MSAFLKEVLEDAWYSLSPEQRALMSKTVLAERILISAAKGEGDREPVLATALRFAGRHPSLMSQTRIFSECEQAMADFKAWDHDERINCPAWPQILKGSRAAALFNRTDTRSTN